MVDSLSGQAGRSPVPELADGRYETVQVLGTGTFGTVVLARDKGDSDELVAVKYVDLKDLRQIDRKVIGFKRCILTEHHLGFVMEYAEKGNLFAYVKDKSRLSEVEARWFYKQLILAMDYCHARGIANRDIKLENTLLHANQRPDLKPLLKLCDFGLSINQAKSVAKSTVGTPGYIAPELHKGLPMGYIGSVADVFSSGVLLYTMLVGAYPYDKPSDARLSSQMREVRVRERIRQGAYSFPRHVKLTAEAKDLVAKLLCPDPSRRITLPEVEAHPWVAQGLPRLDLSFNDNYLRLDSHPSAVAVHARLEAEARALLVQVLGPEDAPPAPQPDPLSNPQPDPRSELLSYHVDHTGRPIEV